MFFHHFSTISSCDFHLNGVIYYCFHFCLLSFNYVFIILNPSLHRKIVLLVFILKSYVYDYFLGAHRQTLFKTFLFHQVSYSYCVLFVSWYKLTNSHSLFSILCGRVPVWILLFPPNTSQHSTPYRHSVAFTCF